MRATLVSELPHGKDWIYEVKWDGYRTLAAKHGTHVRLLSLKNKDLAPTFPAVVAAIRTLRADTTQVDGEIVAIDAEGRPSFQALQNRRFKGRWSKLAQSQEFVIGGYDPEGNRFSSLLAGYYYQGKLMFAGKVRQGFNPQSRVRLHKTLKPLATNRCPFANLPLSKTGHFGQGITAEDMKTLQWLHPRLVAQVSSTEWTSKGMLRHATFLGLREDKDAREVRREDAEAHQTFFKV
jgi:bifunctional non-homologous end joining protein LigD